VRSVENVIIRALRKQDAEEIVRIHAAITKATVSSDFKRVIEEHLQRGGNTSIVAVSKDKVVGYMISYILSGGFGIEKSAWIALLGVDPKYMGQGIGKMLAQEVFNFCEEKSIKNIFTSVEWDSADLLSFFKTLGFDRSKFINLKKTIE
jgi:ribosomal protein S18 acetylase RimI-like enzyme